MLKQPDVDVPIAESIRKLASAMPTFYRCKSKYGGLKVDQVRQLKQLPHENPKQKQLVAELTLDSTRCFRM